MKKHLISAPAIGIYVTFLFVGLAFWYYSKAEMLRESDYKRGFVRYLLETAHEKSIDLRLVLRGEKQADSNIAILAVDGQALREGGRWPWPRYQLAAALDKALELAAQLIAFDVVFSEPSANAAEELANRIRSAMDLPAPVEKRLDEELKTLNSDQIFKEFLQKRAAQLILGALYEEELSVTSLDSLTSLCFSMIFEGQNAAKPWAQDKSLDVKAEYFSNPSLTVPDSLLEAYRMRLSEIERQIIENSPEARTHREEVLLQTSVEFAQRQFCTQFMKEGQDPFFELLDAETWGKLKEAEPSLATYATFTDFSRALQTHNLLQAIPMGWSWVVNIPEFLSVSKHTGYFNADLDSDGTIRRSRLVSRAGTHFVPSLAMKTFLLSQGLKAEVRMGRDLRTLKATQVSEMRFLNEKTSEFEFSAPVDRAGRLLINYRGAEKIFPHVSIAHLMSSDPDLTFQQRVLNPNTHRFEIKTTKMDKKLFFKDKILFLGATATGVFDLRVTPFQENFPGVETHATVLDNLMTRQFLRVSPKEALAMPILLLVAGILLTFAISHLGALPGLLVMLSVFFATGLVDRFFLFQKGIVVMILFPLLLNFGLYVVLTFYKYLTEERAKKELRGVFQKYVSPAIVEEVLSHPDRIELGGRKMDVTVFFSDVRGFTTISEQLDPKALSDLLNEYLTPMTDLVFKNRGTLDKYMGDAIMAFFGAPISFQDHAKWACRCALEHLKKLDELKKEFERRKLPPIEIGIGLNTGDVSVGNMGSESVRNYTVMGDNVNLGSRLEGATKQYGVRILLSQSTYEQVKDTFLCREVDLVRVKGKNLPVKIYELMTEGFTNTEKTQLADKFTAGYGSYHRREFEQAIDYFRQALTLNSSDGVSKVYIERCQAFIVQPPPADWDGVYVMTSK